VITSLRKIVSGQKQTLENLYSYYVYDFSKILPISPQADGRFTFDSKSLEHYWLKPDHHPYFIDCNNELAGFALIRHFPAHEPVWDVDQFFILNKHKGRGVGKHALAKIVALHPGRWQVRVLQENIAALGFWQAAIRALVGEQFKTAVEHDGKSNMVFLRFSVLAEEAN